MTQCLPPSFLHFYQAFHCHALSNLMAKHYFARHLPVLFDPTRSISPFAFNDAITRLKVRLDFHYSFAEMAG